jgi:hypothetical protein
MVLATMQYQTFFAHFGQSLAPKRTAFGVSGISV